MHEESAAYLSKLEWKGEDVKESFYPNLIINSSQQVHEELYEHVKANAEGTKEDKFIYKGYLVSFDFPEINIEPLNPMNPYVWQLFNKWQTQEIDDYIKLESGDWYPVISFLLESPLFIYLGKNYFYCNKLKCKPFYINLTSNDVLSLISENEMENIIQEYKDLIYSYEEVKAAYTKKNAA